MKLFDTNSLRRTGVAIGMIAASLMSLAAVAPALAGKGTDSNRAPAPRTATATIAGVSPHIKAINQNKTWRGNKTDEPCTSIHCNGHGHDHSHQH